MSFLPRFLGEGGEHKKNPPLSAALPREPGFLEVEYCQPLHSDPCPCCGGRTTTLNRLVKRDGTPFAICRITLDEGHLDKPARAILGIGQFGQGTDPNQRVAFGLSLKPEGVTLVDATGQEWPDSEILGPKLKREEALKHPLKLEVLRLIDQLYAEDESLCEFFRAVVARAEPGRSPNAGPAAPSGNSGVS